MLLIRTKKLVRKQTLAHKSNSSVCDGGSVCVYVCGEGNGYIVVVLRMHDSVCGRGSNVRVLVCGDGIAHAR